jgi:hypothetical protein
MIHTVKKWTYGSIWILAVFLLLSGYAFSKETTHHTEKEYVDKFCIGSKEVILSNRSRMDCGLERYAIEYDFAKKWTECLGQALEYAYLTEKVPGCVLILKSKRDWRFVKRMKATVNAWILPVQIWTVTWENPSPQPVQ